MPIIQVFLLLVVLGGLALFAVQNLLPALPLVFLGMKTQALPVAVWITIALAAGFFSSIFLQLLSYLQRRSLQARIRQLEATPNRRESADTASRQTSYTSSQQETPTSDDNASDWETEEPEGEENWDFEEEERKTTSRKNTFETDNTSYEARQEPKSSSKSGSVYSYSYREPRESGVGRTEAVYDANYRVITPPTRETTEKQDDEDWGFSEKQDDEDWGA